MKKTLFENISINLLIRLIGYAFSFFTILHISRVLQPEEYGRASFVASISSYFIMAAGLGMPIYAMRACAKNRGDRGELSRISSELLSISILLSAAAAAVFTLFVFLVPRARENSALMFVYGTGIFFQMIGCEWLYKGLEEFRFLAVSTFFFRLAAFLGILLFVRTTRDTLLYALFSVLASYGTSLVCFLHLHRHVDLSVRFSVLAPGKSAVLTKHFKSLLIFFLMSCATTIYISLDLTILGFLKGNYATGLYTLASKGKTFLTMFSGVVWASVLPRASEYLKSGQKKRLAQLADNTSFVLFVILTGLTLGCMVFAKQVILLVGGSAYLESVLPFRILLLSLLPIGFSNILGGIVLIPSGCEKELLKAEIVGAVVNLLTNLFMIPLFSTAGAAATTVLSEVIVWFLCIYYVKKKLNMDFGMRLLQTYRRKAKRGFQLAGLHLSDQILRAHAPFYCPCCGLNLRHFTSGSYSEKPQTFNPDRYLHMDQDVICPVCYSLPRHRILVSWMQDHLEEIRENSILHFAQESCVRRWMDRNQLHSRSADLFQEADLRLDLQNTGLPSHSCDMIICNHVLEHVPDYQVALAEVRRIIRPGQPIILSFPVDFTLEDVYEDGTITEPADRVRCFGQNDHLRVFGKNTPQLLTDAGFYVEEIRGDQYNPRIKPITGPADYDSNILYLLRAED